MVFYFVNLKPFGKETSQQDEETIDLLFPSSLVGKIFVEGEVFSVEELEKALEIAENQCIKKLTENAGEWFAEMSFIPARKIIQDELGRIDRNQKYVIMEKSESIKLLEESAKHMRYTLN